MSVPLNPRPKDITEKPRCSHRGEWQSGGAEQGTTSSHSKRHRPGRTPGRVQIGMWGRGLGATGNLHSWGSRRGTPGPEELLRARSGVETLNPGWLRGS